MKRQQRQMLILILVLCALAGTFLGLRKYNKIQAEKSVAEEKDGIIVLEVSAEATEAISYDYEGQTYAFVKENGTWYAEADRNINIKQYLVSSMQNALTPLTARQVIENVTDFGQYGLDVPQKTITVEASGQSYTLQVGDVNEVTSGQYVRLPSSDTVYVIDASIISRFEYTLEDLTEETEESGDATRSESD